ncbi:lysosome membrane protein 2-like [Conger conger]|uniref:lysosome membrane protein 2-like n=1 Tax=Conger conger TaxID=82655 RepID=UPI002A5ACA15|nr:lysosome membrane protein 2-like [Conger conger]
MTRRSCAVYATGIVCAHLLIVGIALIVAQVFPTLIQNRLKKEITLTEGSRVFKTWKSPPAKIYMQYFFFNVTNPEVFLSGGLATVKEVGPYTFREYRPRENVTFVDNGTKVSAHTAKSFVFLPEQSVGDPEVDLVTTINIPALAVMNKMSGNFFMSTMVSMWMNSKGSGIFMTRSVDEILWGYKDPLLTSVHSMKPEVEEYFGLMYKKNGTSSGEFVFHTGEENYMDFGKIHTWKGQRETTWWTSKESNMINGTDGGGFHPFVSKDEQLYVFTADLCRSIYVTFVKEVEIKGIPAYRFAPPRDVLASHEENPANEGFCVPAGNCLGTGVLQVKECRKGAPIVVSFPHFYHGAEEYINGVEGLSPNQEHHETFLDINPTLGIPIRASKRAQINVHLKRISGFPVTRKFKPTVFPVLFVNESVVIDDESAAKMRTMLLMVMLVSNFPLLIVGLGTILLIIFIILIVRSRQKKTTAVEDTDYKQVSDKPDEDLSDPQKNGSFIAMSPMEGEKC